MTRWGEGEDFQIKGTLSRMRKLCISLWCLSEARSAFLNNPNTRLALVPIDLSMPLRRVQFSPGIQYQRFIWHVIVRSLKGGFNTALYILIYPYSVIYISLSRISFTFSL